MIKYVKHLSLILVILCIVCLLFSSTYATSITKTAEKPVPILMYHLVSDNLFSSNNNLYTKPKEFEKQIKWISDNGYTTLFAEDLSQAKNVKKPIIITFDDGYADNYEEAFKLAKKYNIKITIFVITDRVNTKNHLTSDQIKEMYESGLVSIQSHTLSHPHLTKLSLSEVDTELLKSKAEIYKLIGKYPTVFAYPYGDVNEKVARIVNKYYWIGYGTTHGTLSNGNILMIKRFGIGRNTTLKDIQKYLESFK